MKRIGFILLLSCANVGMAAEISENPLELQKALNIFAIAQYEFQYGAHSSPSSEAKWAFNYVQAAREKGVHAAILMFDEETKKPVQNEELLFGLYQYLCSEAHHFGDTAGAGSQALCQSLPEREAGFLQDGKKLTFTQDAVGWKDWWEKFKGEEYIQNYEAEVRPKLEKLLDEFFFGTKIQSKTAAIKMDALPYREQLYVEILTTNSLFADKTPKQRQVGIYLKRCMELIAGKHVPVPDPSLSDKPQIWKKWIKSVRKTIDYGWVSANWPHAFWKKLDRKKITEPLVKE